MIDIDAYIADVRSEFEATLSEWVSMPTISAAPDRHALIRDAAGRVAAFLEAQGARARVHETPGLPVVTASFGEDPSQPTVLVYNHLDVQPADEPEWRSDPFRLRIDGDTYHGRGATDDKGPALTALLAARWARRCGVGLNIRFVWEFEEEIGSPNFEAFVRQNREYLAADSIVISDTIWLSRQQPAIPFGLRGLLTARLLLETGTRDVHSGLTGGAARNPLNELARVVTEAVDPETRRIRIPGFYDDVLPVDPDEEAGFLQSGFSPESFRAAHELKRMTAPDAPTLMRRIWTEPTFELHGLVGGYHGPGVKTAIPARGEARISMRLVPDQAPRKVFERLVDFVRSRNPDIEVVADSMLSPFTGPREGPYREAAVDAVRTAFGESPVGVREGGSIGAVVTLDRYLGVPILFLGLSLPEHGYHAPNEHFDWTQAAGGMRMFARYFGNLAGLKRTD
jgi:acetylornithine deacetylase/succinyl-diaminopimelate desuccinylase-like protein